VTTVERRTQEERSATTRQVVLDATIGCLIEHGYRGTTTTAIHERAGVSRGALTHQFPSKNELLAAAISHLADVRAAEMLESAATGADGHRPARGRVAGAVGDVQHRPVPGAIELWVASRTDDDLHATLLAAEREIARHYQKAGSAMFGGIVDRPGFVRAWRRW
jgi:AcrR family transcriptional regulator